MRRAGQAATWHSFEQKNTSKHLAHFVSPAPLYSGFAQSILHGLDIRRLLIGGAAHSLEKSYAVPVP
jgi:hypothetical protein